MRGWLVAPLSVGGRLVVRQDDDRQLTSTAIRRMLVEDPEAQVVFLETQNSATASASSAARTRSRRRRKAVRVQFDDDSREITLVEELAGETGTQPQAPLGAGYFMHWMVGFASSAG